MRLSLMLAQAVGVGLAGLGGWITGSLHPAPAQLTSLVARAPSELRVEQNWAALQRDIAAGRLDPKQLVKLQTVMTAAGAAQGTLIPVEKVDPAQYAEVQATALSAEDAPTPAPPATSGPVPAQSAAKDASVRMPAPVAVASSPLNTVLALCPGMSITNSPPADSQGVVVGGQGVVRINGVALTANPTQGACLSSGFGGRNGHLHKGVDFYSRVGGPISAPADGVVLEKKYRDDYGNMLLIDNGGGVYTRYAHLSAFADGVAVGARIKAGAPLGLMGNTAAYPIPIHLHYEVLVGDYNNPKGSFGLKPRDPFNPG